MGWFSRRCPDAGVGQGMAGRNWPPLDSWCFPSFRFGLFIPHTRLLLHRLFGCNVSIYTRMVNFSTSLAVLTSRGRLLNVPPMGGFRYFAFKNGERLEWPSCCPVLPRGAAESSWGGSFMVSSNTRRRIDSPSRAKRRAVCYLLLLYDIPRAQALRGDN